MRKLNAYKFRIYPTPEQEEHLFKTIGCARKTYNELLSRYNDLYDEYEEKIKSEKKLPKQQRVHTQEYYSRSRLIQCSTLKTDLEYLKEVDSLALANSKLNLDTAFKRFFTGVSDKPVYKKRNASKWSYTTNVVSKNITLTKEGLKLPKLKDRVRIIVHRNPKGILKKATITKDKDGRWYASLLYSQKSSVSVYPDTIQEITNPGAGDLGVKDLITLSNGLRVENIRVLRKYEDKLARQQRVMSRRAEQAKRDGKKLSEAKNYQKARLEVARTHSKIRRVREDHLHKVTHLIAGLFDFFALEDLRSSNLMKNHKLAKAIQDVSWDKFTTFLEYKMVRKGGVIVYIDQYYPSTQLCSHCEEKTGPKGISNLSVREWKCSDCGVIHDRDVNAALNILFEGLRLLSIVFDRWDNGGSSLEPSLVIRYSDIPDQNEGLPECSQENDHNKTSILT